MPASEHPAADRPAVDRWADEQSEADVPMAEEPAADPPSKSRPAPDGPTDGQPTEYGTADRPSARAQSTDPSPAGQSSEEDLLAVVGGSGQHGEPMEALQPGDDEEPQSAVGETRPAGPSLRTIVESLLLVVDEPVSELALAEVAEAPREAVGTVLAELAQEYEAQERGFDLRCVAGGWRLYTRADCARYVERFTRDGQQARLTQAALETLAVVAYRQPVSRGRVAAVRGVNVDGVMRTLLARGLVEEAGTEKESGAVLYRTTSYFLERLGLRSVDELPPIAPHLPDLETIDMGAE